MKPEGEELLKAAPLDRAQPSTDECSYNMVLREKESPARRRENKPSSKGSTNLFPPGLGNLQPISYR